MAPIITKVSTGPADIYSAGEANVPGTPVYVGNVSGTILFALDQNSNGNLVQYAIYLEEGGVGRGYLNDSWLDNGGLEHWHTATDWGSVLQAINLTIGVLYRIKAKAKNEAGVETAFSDYSAYMTPYVPLDIGPESNTVTYECTTGKCKISGVTITGTSKVVNLSFSLTRINTPATLNNVKIYYSADGITYGATDIATLPGVITGSVTSLAASVAGTQHPVSPATLTWATCLTVGNSFHGSVWIKIVPYDTATGGNAETAGIATGTIDNRPLAVVISETNTYTWDKYQYPIIIAAMSEYICGDSLYFLLDITNTSTGILEQSLSSAEIVDGWEYETSTGVWVEPDLHGVPIAYVPLNATGNRIRYTLQSPLTQGQNYSFVLYQAEEENVIT